MSHEHLTDDQIQEILDARLPEPGPFLPWHLRDCPGCRERFEAFQRLYAGLAADPGFALPPGFADAVLEKIPAARLTFFRAKVTPLHLSLAAGTLGVLALAIWLDWRPLLSGWASLAHLLDRSFQLLAPPLRGLLSLLGGSARPFVIGGLGLLSASLLERVLRRQSMRHSH